MEILQGVWEVIVSIFTNSGYAYFFTADGGYKNAIMLLVAFVFLYLGIKKGFEPLLMVPIAFGMLLANIPEANLAVQYHDLDGFRDLLAGRGEFVGCTPGLMDFLYFGVKAGIYPLWTSAFFLAVADRSVGRAASACTNCHDPYGSRTWCLYRWKSEYGI